MTILSLDPGTAKCGIAALSLARDTACQPTVLRHSVISSGEAADLLVEWVGEFNPTTVLVGNATGGASLIRALRERLGDKIPVLVVPERGTSERARARYFVENPPRGWKRLVPVGLQTPPIPYDDYAAIILAEDWLATQTETG